MKESLTTVSTSIDNIGVGTSKIIAIVESCSELAVVEFQLPVGSGCLIQLVYMSIKHIF